MEGYSLQLILGMVLLLANPPVAWGGVALCAYLAKRTGKKIYYGFGTALYVVSWGMLALGAFLAGSEGVSLVKKVTRTYHLEVMAVDVILLIGVAFYVFKKRKKLPEVSGDGRA
ncbi:MAG: hypothetical protein ACYC5N_00530 [Endomicrobiales bacterium]